MLDDLERENPGTKQIMLAALRNVKPSQLLDAGLWKSLGLAVADERDEQREAGMVPEGRLRIGRSSPWSADR